MAKTKMPITVAGSQVQVSHETVPLDQVQLDPGNPRIRFLIRHKKGGQQLSPAELMLLIKEQAGYDGLQKAIRKAGGLHDPIIIRNDGMVVEGNSRTTALKTLHEGNKADPRWKTIPVVRLPKDVSEKAIAMLMASYHIAGKTVWRPYAKADQIYELRFTHNWQPSQIADETRMSEREVEQHIDAYKYLLEEVLPEAEDGNGSSILESKFHHALEFIKRKNLAAFREDPKIRKQLAKLLVQDKIRGAEVRDLDKVLKSRKASTALTKDGFKAAKEVLQKADPVAASKVLKGIRALTLSLGRMGPADISLLKTSEKARRVLIDLNDALRSVAAVAHVKLGGRNG